MQAWNSHDRPEARGGDSLPARAGSPMAGSKRGGRPPTTWRARNPGVSARGTRRAIDSSKVVQATATGVNVIVSFSRLDRTGAVAVERRRRVSRGPARRRLEDPGTIDVRVVGARVLGFGAWFCSVRPDFQTSHHACVSVLRCAESFSCSALALGSGTLLVHGRAPELAWPQFRGPAGRGRPRPTASCRRRGPAKDNVAWSVEVPGPRLVVAGGVGQHRVRDLGDQPAASSRSRRPAFTATTTSPSWRSRACPKTKCSSA